MNAPIMLYGFPRAIVHVDGDAFFASVEQALVPSLRGRPLVTGKERGIIACASYEAKAMGIARGMRLSEAKQRCPGLIILPSDYETYSLYSKRMFNIMRTYTPHVEEYSIDEAFADLSGLRRLHRKSYEAIARDMQAAIHRELGVTVSVGLSLTKSLAKLCSKHRKPAGLTVVEGRRIHEFLPGVPTSKVWGFGPNTVDLLEKQGVRDAYAFVTRPETWAVHLLGKPGRDIWNELRGRAVWPVNPGEARPQATIIKSKTFTPPSRDPAMIYAELLRNVAGACAKARRHRLRPRRLGVVLRRQDFKHEGLEVRLTRSTAVTSEVLPTVRELFKALYRPDTDYRATLIALGELEDDRQEQGDLFENRVQIEARRRVTGAVDAINDRYGKHTVRCGSELFLSGKPPGSRDERPERHSALVPGETRRQRLAIPRMTLTV